MESDISENKRHCFKMCENSHPRYYFLDTKFVLTTNMKINRVNILRIKKLAVPRFELSRKIISDLSTVYNSEIFVTQTQLYVVCRVEKTG